MTTESDMTGRYVDAFAKGKRLRAFVPDALPPAVAVAMDGAMLDLFAEASLALGGLKQVSTQLPDIGIFLYSYVRKEALLSSQIEEARTRRCPSSWSMS